MNSIFMQPGNVGSVGDTLMSVKLKHNYPDAPLRFLPYTHGRQEMRYGSNVQNGYIPSFSSHGRSARLNTSSFNPKAIQNSRSTIYHEPKLLDCSTTPYLGALPGYGYKTWELLPQAGNLFKTMPLGFQPKQGDIPRGAQVPQRTILPSTNVTRLKSTSQDMIDALNTSKERNIIVPKQKSLGISGPNINNYLETERLNRSIFL